MLYLHFDQGLNSRAAEQDWPTTVSGEKVGWTKWQTSETIGSYRGQQCSTCYSNRWAEAPS